MATKNDATRSELQALANAGDAGAALELFAMTSRKERDPDYKWDSRTPAAVDSVTGDSFGVVEWYPMDTATQPDPKKKYFYVIRLFASDGHIEVIHTAGGRALTIDRPSAMKNVIAAFKLAGIIREPNILAGSNRE